MKFLFFLLALFMFFSCGQQVRQTVIVDIPLKEALLKCDILNNRFKYKSKVEKIDDSYFLQCPFGELRIKKIKDKTEFVITAKSREYNKQIRSFLEQTKTRVLMENRNIASKKNRLGLIGLHLISPSFSYLYAEAKNPFFKEISPVAKFFLHLGIDGLIVLTTGTDLFSDEFKFRASTATALFVHRAFSLPTFMINMDFYNRSLQAGYNLKF